MCRQGAWAALNRAAWEWAATARFGALRLAGPAGPRGTPTAPARAAARDRARVDHIDTTQFYDPDAVNDLIRGTMRPFWKT